MDVCRQGFSCCYPDGEKDGKLRVSRGPDALISGKPCRICQLKPTKVSGTKNQALYFYYF